MRRDVSMLRTTSTGSRSMEGIASGSWLIATLPELYSIRSRGSSEASCAMRGSVSSGWPASLWRIANGFKGKSRFSASFAAVITGAISVTVFMTISPGVSG